MSFGGIQILLLYVFVYQSVTIEVEEVKPRWVYKDNRSNKTKSLPDSIHIDLQLESAKITLNLIKQSTEAFKTPFFAPELEGQSSNHSDDEFLGIYKDLSLEATATVSTQNTQNTNGMKETLYMITFTHDGKPVSFGPKAIIEDNPFFSNLEEDADAGDNKHNNKLLNINGVLHSLQETPSSTAQHNDLFDNDFVNDTVKEKKIMKRSEFSPGAKRLMTVEIFTVIDFSIFDSFVGLSKATSYEMKKEDARKSIRYVFTHIMEGLKDMYENIKTEDLKFTTKWVGAFIAERSRDVPFLESSMKRQGILDRDTTLKNMKNWLKDESSQSIRTNWPKFDFLVTFTRFSVHSVEKWKTKTTINGFAKPGGVCTSERIGVVRFMGFYPSSTLAHELGHSLGSVHDHANLNNSVMYEYSGKKGEFSESSINQFKSHIQRLDRKSNNCLEDGGENVIHGRDRDIFLHLYPGQLFDLDEQCKLYYGLNSSIIVDDHYNECQSTSCYNGETITPIDGTTCGNRAWCQGGRCVPNSKAPRAPENCVHGDRGIKNYCKDVVKQFPDMCSYLDKQCCATCIGKGANIEVCSDVISECSSLHPKDCYHDYYANACCKTCQALVLNPSDANCLYGDKGTGCQDFVPEICHLPTRYCCQTCAGYLSPTNTTHNNSPVTTNISSTTTKSCSDGDYNGSLEYVNVWGIKWKLTCKQLIERDSSLCKNDSVRRHCCSSCSGAEMVGDSCESDNDTVRHVYLSKKFTCKQLVDYMPRLCEQENFRKKCCKSCGRFTIRLLN